MMKFETKHAFLQEDINAYQEKVTKLHNALNEKTCKGNDYVGWVNWPYDYDKEEFDRLLKTAKRVRENCDVLLVCGIGGSYLGVRAAAEMVKGLYPENGVELIYIGNTFSSTYFKQIEKYIENKSVVCNVISKSGTTTETAVAFRMIRQLMEKKYGKEECKKRILATTDRTSGTLKAMADQEGYETFVIPNDIGGRYSVITPVGLLPLAIAGVDVEALMKGCQKAYDDLNTADLNENKAYQYAVCRRILEKQGKCAEMLVSYEPQMAMVAEWWKQLLGESEGKEEKGILPCSANFSTDLHSLGQFIQEGTKVLYETLLLVEEPTLDQKFPADDQDLDGMNYLAGKKLDWINKMACEGTMQAHVETGGVPNLVITIKDMSASSFGYMCYFFFKACAMTCLLLDINPFDQPGVEVYKKNMFRLLGKN